MMVKLANKIGQESGTGNGDVTDIVVTRPGEGYTKTPLVTLPPKSLLINDDYRITLQTAAAIGDVYIGRSTRLYNSRRL